MTHRNPSPNSLVFVEDITRHEWIVRRDTRVRMEELNNNNNQTPTQNDTPMDHEGDIMSDSSSSHGEDSRQDRINLPTPTHQHHQFFQNTRVGLDGTMHGVGPSNIGPSPGFFLTGAGGGDMSGNALYLCIGCLWKETHHHHLS